MIMLKQANSALIAEFLQRIRRAEPVKTPKIQKVYKKCNRRKSTKRPALDAIAVVNQNRRIHGQRPLAVDDFDVNMKWLVGCSDNEMGVRYE